MLLGLMASFTANLRFTWTKFWTWSKIDAGRRQHQFWFKFRIDNEADCMRFMSLLLAKDTCAVVPGRKILLSCGRRTVLSASSSSRRDRFVFLEPWHVLPVSYSPERKPLFSLVFVPALDSTWTPKMPCTKGSSFSPTAAWKRVQFIKTTVPTAPVPHIRPSFIRLALIVRIIHT